MKLIITFGLFSFLVSASAFAQPLLVDKDMSQYRPGSIIIDTKSRRLHYVLSSHQALEYRVAVPQATKDKDWYGDAYVVGKQPSPAWKAPASVVAVKPELAKIIIPSGAPNNPMGTRVILLSRHEIAIHGTSQSMRNSVIKGQAASFGCIRMLNEDIEDLYQRVDRGTAVLKK